VPPPVLSYALAVEYPYRYSQTYCIAIIHDKNGKNSDFTKCNFSIF
jgi:hypothetical protein